VDVHQSGRCARAWERTGAFRTGANAMLFDAAGMSFISAEDFAVALVNELEESAHVRERITVSY
jgi:putative NADH-flavin reductase